MKIQSTVSDVFYKGNVSPAGCCIGYYCSDGYCEKIKMPLEEAIRDRSGMFR